MKHSTSPVGMFTNHSHQEEKVGSVVKGQENQEGDSLMEDILRGSIERR
ncbi:hypothetical protein BVRB_8g182690 [Beta vulgaris subsp. vulgaris]|nr:hypothetical protein BVRB_8g182690 [Beta vulgaris subsp. vulgaris]